MAEPSEISLFDVAHKVRSFFRFLLSKWLTILLLGLLGGTAGFVLGWKQTPKYRAALSFAMEDDRASGGIAGLAAQFGVDIGGQSGGAFSGNNIVALIESDKIAENTLLSTVKVNGKNVSLLNMYLDIEKYPQLFAESGKPELKNLSFPENQDPATFTRVQDSVLKVILIDMHGSVKISKPDEKLNLYAITCTTKNEAFSLAYCKRLIEQASAFYVSLKTKKSAQVVEVLQKRSDSLRKAYNAALYSRAELSDANLNPAFQTPTVSIQGKQTDISVFGTAYGELLKNLEIAKFNLLRETPVIQVLDEPALPLTKVRIGKPLGTIIGSFVCVFLFLSYVVLKRVFRQPIKNPA